MTMTIFGILVDTFKWLIIATKECGTVQAVLHFSLTTNQLTAKTVWPGSIYHMK